ncbi:hypothetical protein [Streptomyces sp. NPDC047718]|uniref:hypothetical protein n=1 Tax=Streptomyces sp. NPDC047718 TaxID=3155479 RepID=UPI00340272D8
MTWAVDLTPAGTLLTSHGQWLLYIPGRAVHRPGRGYRGDGKAVVKRRPRHRRSGTDALTPAAAARGDGIAVDLEVLAGRRPDLAADRNRAIDRMPAQAPPPHPVVS